MSHDIETMSGEELKQTVEGILADPAFGKLVNELRGVPESGTPMPSDAVPTALPQISPDMMAKLPQIMAAISPLLSAPKRTEESPHTEGGEKKSLPADQQKKLLAALRPYLNDHRKHAVDNILRVTEMTELLGGIAPKRPEP